MVRDAPAIVLAVAAALPGSCTQPAHRPALLKEISAECQALIRANPSKDYVSVPERDWPPAIAGLKPEFVTVYPEGVNITTRAFFDGGWGYFVQRSGGTRRVLPNRYSALGSGVYWYGPD